MSRHAFLTLVRALVVSCRPTTETQCWLVFQSHCCKSFCQSRTPQLSELVFSARRPEHIGLIPLLRQLHWLRQLACFGENSVSAVCSDVSLLWQHCATVYLAVSRWDTSEDCQCRSSSATLTNFVADSASPVCCNVDADSSHQCAAQHSMVANWSLHRRTGWFVVSAAAHGNAFSERLPSSLPIPFSLRLSGGTRFVQLRGLGLFMYRHFLRPKFHCVKQLYTPHPTPLPSLWP